MNSETDSCGTMYVFLQYTESAPALDEVDKELGLVLLGWRTKDEKDRSAVGGEERSNRTKKIVGE